MSTGALISIGEYLSTAYRPDCDYVDGIVEERNVGEHDHGRLQGVLFAYLYAREKQWRIHAIVEQRVQVSPTRFRIPDVCFVTSDTPIEAILTKPPFACIEILSPEDRLTRVQERIDDYLSFGVPYLWILNPENRKAYRCTREGMQEVQELRTENPDILVPIEDLFGQ